MGKPLKIFLGLSLAVAGLASTVCGLKLILNLNQFAATTRVKIYVVESYGEMDSNGNLQPQTENSALGKRCISEIFQSPMILSNVVTDLELNQNWSKRHQDGSLLTTTESMAVIQKNMRIEPINGTFFFDITYTSHDANEAELVANTIAEGYLDWHLELRNKYVKYGLKVMQEELQKEEQHILTLQTNVEQLHQQFGIQNDTATSHLPEQKAFWDEKYSLEKAQVNRNRLKASVENLKPNISISEDKDHKIIDLAKPLKSPIYFNRFLGALLLLLGLGLLAGGLVLLKSTRKECVIVPPSLP